VYRQNYPLQKRAVTADPSSHLYSILKNNPDELLEVVSAPNTTKNVQFDDNLCSFNNAAQTQPNG
jgi:hypothetical protein